MQVFMKEEDGSALTVYVNPHSGAVVGSQKTDRTLMQIAHDLHGSLLIGRPGEILMELTAWLAFTLVAAGVLLWWPRRKLWAKAWVSDAHGWLGFGLCALIFLFLSTGIPWTGTSGRFLGEIGAATGTGSPPGFGGSPYKSTPLPGQTPLPLDALVAIRRERLPSAADAYILIPANPSGAAVIRWKAPRPQDRAYIHVDRYSGQIIADYRWKDFGLIGKFTLMAVALHEGTWFGAWNQALNSVVALGVLFLAGSGLFLWYRRRNH
jgi:LPXTG-motif cell wall-anchored protein